MLRLAAVHNQQKHVQSNTQSNCTGLERKGGLFVRARKLTLEVERRVATH